MAIYTAAQLLGILQTVPADTEIWLASDEEGNEFHGLEDAAPMLVSTPGKGKRKVLMLWPGFVTAEHEYEEEHA